MRNTGKGRENKKLFLKRPKRTKTAKMEERARNDNKVKNSGFEHAIYSLSEKFG